MTLQRLCLGRIPGGEPLHTSPERALEAREQSP